MTEAIIRVIHAIADTTPAILKIAEDDKAADAAELAASTDKNESNDDGSDDDDDTADGDDDGYTGQVQGVRTKTNGPVQVRVFLLSCAEEVSKSKLPKMLIMRNFKSRLGFYCFYRPQMIKIRNFLQMIAI